MNERSGYVCSYGVWRVSRVYLLFFKQKAALEVRISDWSSDVCSSDLHWGPTKSTNLCLEIEDVFDSDLPLGETELHGRCTDRHAESGLEIGRASGRERVCQYVKISGVAVSLKKQLD